jgi:predicted flap endonuclease-1-like 5' DNA nuclease
VSKIIEVEGIGEAYAKKLEDAGIRTTDAFLEKCGSPAGRKSVAEQTGINPELILKWTNHVDLFRIKGVAGEYAELLEAAGVDTVPELAQRNAANLMEKLESTNEKKKLVRKLPVESEVARWVEQAKALPRLVTY